MMSGYNHMLIGKNADSLMKGNHTEHSGKFLSDIHAGCNVESSA